MSDDFDDDDFDFDDSFLREVDHIEAKATNTVTANASTNAKSNGPTIVPVQSVTPRVWSSGQNTPFKPVVQQRLTPKSFSRPTPAGPSRQRIPPPSSDDYDDFSIDIDAMEHIDQITKPASANRPGPKQSTIPSSRLGLSRIPSSSSSSIQTHLNFRKENQTTKGKRWDRTAFAESGRRIGAEKAKAKGKSGYKARVWARDDDEMEDDEEDKDEEEEFEPLVPGPKPFVDVNKPYEPQRHLPNSATIDTYIYPTNRPKRDYQYEIVKACFTDNCLVALPTGLGKTFVAGVLMLNFYRWFPTGKIVFLAPTKPLVNQQIEACQMTCGIPSADAAVMTGASDSTVRRAKTWEERRVFYCTPQTLDNDLKTGSVDPRDIVLAVFDEAHKASGSYAYTTILAYITAQNPYFRVLALTATPGADVPRVQAVVDALHISRIEIREAEAPEIRKYMNEKRTEKHIVQMGEVIEEFRDRFADLMKPSVKKLVDADVLNERDLDVKKMRTFRLTSKRMEIARTKGAGAGPKWAMGPLQALEKMARAMGHLLEFSIGMFHSILTEIAGNTTAQGKKAMSKGSSTSMRNNFEFQRLMRDVEAEINSIRVGRAGKTKADKHPKMQKTLELLLAHFTQAADDERDHGIKNDTRAMVFCSFRDAVLEIVDMLNDHPGILSATKFVGQQHGKQEIDKGFTQKDQKQAIADFKAGKFNVLVSTSIGEEGLDIGEVDFVVVYDMPKQSIKLLQRIGRTGRKRAGEVHVLMSEGREDANWDKAQQTHRDIQEEILHSRNLELFEDVERLLPPGKLPECIEQEMPVDPWDPGEGKTRKRLAALDKDEKAKGKKEKEKKQRGHEIPENGHTGFKTVAELLKESGKTLTGAKKKATLPKNKGIGRGKPAPVVTRIRAKDADGNEIPDPWEDSVVASDENAGSRVTSPGSKKGKSKAKAKAKDNVRSKKGKAKETEPLSTDSDESEDTVDLDNLFADLENKGRKPTIKRKAVDQHPGPTSSAAQSETLVDNQIRPEARGNDIICDSDEGEHSETLVETVIPTKAKKTTSARAKSDSKKGGKKGGSEPSRPSEKQRVAEISAQKAKERAEYDQAALDFFSTATAPRRKGVTPPLATPPSSPPPFRPTLNTLPPSPESPPRSPLRGPAAPSVPAPKSNRDKDDDKAMGGARLSPSVAALAGFSQIAPIDLEWEDDLISSPPPPPPALSTPPRSAHQHPMSVPPSVEPISSGLQPSGVRRRIMGLSRPKGSSVPLRASASTAAMPPPPVPVRSSPAMTSPLTAARPPPLVASSPIAPTPPPVRRGSRRLRAQRDEPRVRQSTRRTNVPAIDERQARKRQKMSKEVGRYLDLDVELSGSDASSDEPSSDIETESDRLFAGEEFAPTQAPRGYNQHAAYMAGMSTQAAGRNGLKFNSRYDTTGFLAKARKPVLISEDERSEGAETDENEYEMGSFVCDDEDISFANPLDSP